MKKDTPLGGCVGYRLSPTSGAVANGRSALLRRTVVEFTRSYANGHKGIDGLLPVEEVESD